jgi:hypothetical protein
VGGDVTSSNKKGLQNGRVECKRLKRKRKERRKGEGMEKKLDAT